MAYQCLRFLREFRPINGNSAKVYHLCAVDSQDTTVACIRYGILKTNACLYSVNVDTVYRGNGLATYLRYIMSKHSIQENKTIIHRSDWTDMGEHRFADDPEDGFQLFENLEKRVMKRHGTLDPEYSCLRGHVAH